MALVFVFFSGAASATCPPQIEADFRAALAVRDEAKIYAATAAARACLGDPKPETPERYETPLRLLAQPQGEETIARIEEYWAGASSMMWWAFPNPPMGANAMSPLRQPAAALRGAAMALRDHPDDADRFREHGERATSYLVSAQKQSGKGLYPTPAWEGASRDRVRALTDRFVKQARKDGVLAQVVSHGWIIDDQGKGDLQFDNGLSGEAILVWNAVNPQAALLASARAAGDWAMAQPLSTNFNYNGFTAAFLARLGQATGDTRYTDEAVARIRLGVLPGMIVEGPFAGHWIDPHNARLVYRLIMIRQMAVVASALAQGHPDRAYIASRLQKALDAAEDQQRAVKQIAHWDSSVKAYCELAQLPEVKPKKPDVVSVVRDYVLVNGRGVTPRVDPHAFHCALAIQPPYPNPHYPWETTLWPK